MKRRSLALAAALLVSPHAFGDPLQSAEVTKVINDVKIFRPAAAAKPARIGDTVSGKTSLQTGRRSRSELRFQDKTITRVGANSIFSFEQGTRDLRLEQGTILLTVPKDAGGARIRTATVTAAVTGTSIMMEYSNNDWVKIIVLEGSLDTWLEREGQRKRKTIKAGQMVVLRGNDPRMPEPVDVDVRRLMQTSGLADAETFGPLPVAAENQITAVVNQQTELKSQGILVPPSPGGKAGGPGTNPAERAASRRELVNDRIVTPPPPREGDDPNG